MDVMPNPLAQTQASEQVVPLKVVSDRALNCNSASVLCKMGDTFFSRKHKETKETFSQKITRRVDSKDLGKR